MGGKVSTTTKAWLKGLAAAAISALSTAAGGAVVLPAIFNLSHDGLINTAKIVIVPTLGAVFAYLKASPLPAASITTTSTETVAVTKN